MGGKSSKGKKLSEPTPKQVSSKIDKRVSQLKNEDRNRFKFLLLGTGESGKSTFLKQFTYLFGDGYSESKRNEFAPIVVDNVVSFMQAICRNLEKYNEEFKIDSSLAQDVKTLLDYRGGRFVDANIAKIIKDLWGNEAIKGIFEKYHHVFHVPESAPYFFENVERYVEPNFTPNKEDLINVRARSTGVLETDIQHKGAVLRFVDVGGQRSERNKWIHCFEGVTAILFVVAVSEFDQLLYEDDKTNRIDEALKVFEETINSQWLRNTPVILFFNKRDVLAEKLKTVKLKNFFKNYVDENTLERAVKYFKHLFISSNANSDRDIYCYESCAVSEKNVENIFKALSAIVLTKNLIEADGLLERL
jgi:GTPase SAR1 family protein